MDFECLYHIFKNEMHRDAKKRYFISHSMQSEYLSLGVLKFFQTSCGAGTNSTAICDNSLSSVSLTEIHPRGIKLTAIPFRESIDSCIFTIHYFHPSFLQRIMILKTSNLLRDPKINLYFVGKSWPYFAQNLNFAEL